MIGQCNEAQNKSFVYLFQDKKLGFFCKNCDNYKNRLDCIVQQPHCSVQDFLRDIEEILHTANSMHVVKFWAFC